MRSEEPGGGGGNARVDLRYRREYSQIITLIFVVSLYQASDWQGPCVLMVRFLNFCVVVMRGKDTSPKGKIREKDG